ncbi:MAG: hypothetical protein J6R32_04425 [Bacteroidales bacterium]|nr:hypothetical protein [Bacteroidales bacterium]
MTSIYCESLDGECFTGICEGCEYNTKPPKQLKPFRATYEAVLILSMPEPCGVIKETSFSGDFIVQAESSEAAETKAQAIIESNFTYDYISALNVSEVPIPADEIPVKSCEKCEFNQNGCCVLIF